MNKDNEYNENNRRGIQKQEKYNCAKYVLILKELDDTTKEPKN